MADPMTFHGALASLLSLLNTDDIGTPTGLARWMRAKHPRADHQVPSLQEAAQALEIRDALRRWIAAGTTPDPATLESLNRAGRTTSLRVLFDRSGGARLEPTSPDAFERATGEVLVAVHNIVRSGLWSRLKICGSPGCGWVFFDRSRNRSGVWCAMAVCGNRAKARRFRARRRGAPA